MVAVDGYFPKVCPPDAARVFAEIIVGLAIEPMPSALNVLRGERLAVVPFDTLPKLECEAGAVSFHDQLSASSGMTVSMPPIGFIGSNTTSPLNIGPAAITVVKLTSSRIDKLEGLALMYTRNVPPCFCARAGPAPRQMATIAVAATARCTRATAARMQRHQVRTI